MCHNPVENCPLLGLGYKATVVAKAEPVGRGLSGDGRFNGVWEGAPR
jgi:hypothetical protein